MFQDLQYFFLVSKNISIMVYVFNGLCLYKEVESKMLFNVNTKLFYSSSIIQRVQVISSMSLQYECDIYISV